MAKFIELNFIVDNDIFYLNIDAIESFYTHMETGGSFICMRNGTVSYSVKQIYEEVKKLIAEAK